MFTRLKASMFFAYRFNFDVYGQKRKLSVAVWAFSTSLRHNLVWRFKLNTFIQNMITPMANNTLRHPKSP
jgi:hypothetical protein